MAEIVPSPHSGPSPASPCPGAALSRHAAPMAPAGTPAAEPAEDGHGGIPIALHAAPGRGGPDEPWASGQRKRYLNSLHAGELAA